MTRDYFHVVLKTPNHAIERLKFSLEPPVGRTEKDLQLTTTPGFNVTHPVCLIIDAINQWKLKIPMPWGHGNRGHTEHGITTMTILLRVQGDISPYESCNG